MYVKAYARYHQSISSQRAPQYFYPGYLANGYGIGQNVSSDIKTFSLASGFKYGGGIGYQFNNVLGIETGIDYFSTKSNFKADANFFVIAATTKWAYQSIEASPSLTAKKIMNKSSLIIKAGPVIGVAWLLNTVKAGSYLSRTYQLEKHITLGYTMGMEYDRKINDAFSFVIECGLEHSSYTPSKANLKAIKYPGSMSVQDQNEYRKKIVYAKEVRNLDVTYNYNNNNIFQGSFVSDENKPETRIKQSIKFNTAFFGIGVKYNFGRNEKQ